MFDLSTRILIVDDMVMVRKLITKVCKEAGFNDFLEAANGATAWEAITSSIPQVGIILSDWNMPSSTGLDLLKRVRGDSRTKSIPFIMITAEAQHDQIKEAVLHGVSNYLVKPFTKESLMEKLEAIYAKQATA